MLNSLQAAAKAKAFNSKKNFEQCAPASAIHGRFLCHDCSANHTHTQHTPLVTVQCYSVMTQQSCIARAVPRGQLACEQIPFGGEHAGVLQADVEARPRDLAAHEHGPGHRAVRNVHCLTPSWTCLLAVQYAVSRWAQYMYVSALAVLPQMASQQGTFGDERGILTTFAAAPQADQAGCAGDGATR